jgi:PAS domain S-box-containing protein
MNNELDELYVRLKDASFFRQVLEHLGIPVYLINVETCRLVNGSGTCHEISHGNDHPCDSFEHTCGLRLAVEKKRAVSLRHRHYDSSGKPLEVEVYTLPLFDSDGSVPCVLEFSLDLNREQDKLSRLRVFQQIIDQIPTSIVLTDRGGNIEYVNPSFSEITGYSPDEVIGKNPRVLKDPDRPSSDYRELWNTISSGKSWRGEFHNRKKDGSFYWEDALVAPVKDAAGKIVNYIAIKENSSPRKQLEERVWLQARAMDDSTNAIVISDAKDPNHPAIYVNKSFEKLTGYTWEETKGRNFRFLYGEDSDQPQLKIIREALNIGEPCRCLLRNYRKDGSLFWNELRITPLKDEKGKLTHFVGSFDDVTEYQRIQQELYRNEERLRLSQEFANIGTWDWKIRTGELHWSDQVTSLFGYDRKTIEATYENFIGAIHPDDRQMVTDAINDCIEQGTDYRIEHRVVWPDGSVHWLQESGNVNRDGEGRPLNMLGLVQDITGRVESEQNLTASREEAEKANRAKSEFLSSMSHELRTPMNAIIGFGQLLEMDSELKPDQKDSVQEIARAGKHLLNLINEILDLSRIELGKIELSPESLDCEELIVESLTLIHLLAGRSGIEIVHEKAENLFVYADRIRLKQVLVNLLSNAVKYNKPGGMISIGLVLEGDMVRFTVEDTGIGIASDRLESIFEPFTRIETGTEEIEGTGIGLSICRSLIESMNGSIRVESEPGRGSVFSFELPAAEKKEQAVIPDQQERSEILRKSIEGIHTVLYIEDDPSNIRLMEHTLGSLPSIHLLTAAGAKEGLRIAEADMPELILLDLSLPEMDGFTVLKILRKEVWGRDIPVVALSAHAMPGDIERGKQAGFTDYLTKPVDFSRLYALVEDLLGRSNSL